MAGGLHDEIKAFLVNKLWKISEGISEGAFTTELRLDKCKLDIANRNYTWIVEVEPTSKQKDEGLKQLVEYVKQIRNKKGIEEVCAILCYHKDAKTPGDAFRKNPQELAFFVLEGENLTPIDWDTFMDLAKKSLQEKLPVEGRTFAGLFRGSKEEFYERLRGILCRYYKKIRPLYKVYETELKKIYPDADKKKIRELYVLHTILNAAAVCLVNTIIYPHRSVEERFTHKKGFSLPFLNWWFVLYRQNMLSDEDKEEVKKFMESIASIVDSFDWSKGKQKDIFRLLYEEYVEEEDRRKIGEYYTPTWFVRWCLDKAGQDCVSMPVLDPCCGTGTFLDEALRRKIENGIDPDSALSNVIGFDINPLAVVLARAELFLTYRIAGGEENSVPLVFYGDSSLWLADNIKLLKLSGEKKDDYIHTRNLLSMGQFPFDELPKLEYALEEVFEEVEKKIKNAENKKAVACELLSEGLQKIITIGFKNKNLSAKKLFNIDRIAEEIALFGNGIWAVAVVSAIAKYSIESKLSEECFIATNPPWIALTRIKGAYGKLIRSILKGYGAKGQEITGGDISSLFLCRYGENKGVFVMPKAAVYSGSYGMGANISINCLNKKPHQVYLFSYDIFKHGIVPAVVVVGKGSGEVYEVNLKKAYGKGDEEYAEEDFEFTQKDKEDYEIAMQAFSTPLGIKKIASKVRINGTYIRGLKGGELKRGAKKYAGLILKTYNRKTGAGKLVNMKEEVFMGTGFKEKWVRKLIYIDRVLPFKLLPPYDVVLSDQGEERLKVFLKELANKAQNEEDRKSLLILAEEVKQAKPEYLARGKYYFLHRVKGMFSSAVVEPTENGLYVVENALCYVEFSQPEPAYYYCGLVNYLIEKVQRGFHRNIHSRVLRAFDLLGLHWQGADWQVKVANLSKVLHEIMAKEDVKDNEKALQVLREKAEFKDLVCLIDKHVDSSKLCEAISLLRAK